MTIPFLPILAELSGSCTESPGPFEIRFREEEKALFEIFPAPYCVFSAQRVVFYP